MAAKIDTFDNLSFWSSQGHAFGVYTYVYTTKESNKTCGLVTDKSFVAAILNSKMAAKNNILSIT